MKQTDAQVYVANVPGFGERNVVLLVDHAKEVDRLGEEIRRRLTDRALLDDAIEACREIERVGDDPGDVIRTLNDEVVTLQAGGRLLVRDRDDLRKEVAELKAKMATMIPKPHTRVFTHKTLVGEGWSFVGSDGGKWYNSREKAVAAAYAQGFIVDNEEG